MRCGSFGIRFLFIVDHFVSSKWMVTACKSYGVPTHAWFNVYMFRVGVSLRVIKLGPHVNNSMETLMCVTVYRKVLIYSVTVS